MLTCWNFQGLTDKFKEKDTRFTGSATLQYDTFMSMVIPFLVSYDWAAVAIPTCKISLFFGVTFN